MGRLAISPTSVRLGYPESRPLHFEWTPTASLEKRHGAVTVFVHLLDKPGSVLRTFDHPFPGEWTPGKPVAYDIELYQSALGKSLPPGRYILSVGLYDSSWGYRWNLEAGGPDLGKREYRVAALDVPDLKNDPASAGAFEFSGDWGPPEPDGSVQVLARRKIMGPAALRFSAPPAAAAGGVLRLGVTVVNDPIPVETDCGSGPGSLVPGYHRLGLEMPPSGTCEVRFLVAARAEIGRPHAGSIDVAAWRPPVR